MSTPAERQMLASMRQMASSIGKANGAAPFTTMLERGTGDREMESRDANHPERLIVSVYSLEKSAAEAPSDPPSDADKPKGKQPEPKADPIKIAIKLETDLPDGTPYLLGQFKVDTLGVTELPIPKMSASYRMSVEVSGEAEYAVFGW